MVERQRSLIASGDYVAEGRDIGTVVSPDAPLKVFLDRRPRRAGSPPGRGDRRGPARRCSRRSAARDARDREPRARRPAPGRRCGGARYDGALGRRGRGADRGAGRRAGARMKCRAPPQIAVVGFPNVGKSTLVNRLAAAGRRSSIASPASPATARPSTCEWNGRRFGLIDTGGVDLEAEASLSRRGPGPGAGGDRRGRCGRAGRRRPRGPAPGDAEVARDPAARRRARGGGRQQGRRAERRRAPLAAEFHRLGLGEPSPGLGGPRASAPAISSIAWRSGKAALAGEAVPDAEAEIARIAVIGRPNGRCETYRKSFPMTEIALPAYALRNLPVAKWARDQRIAIDVCTGMEFAVAIAAGIHPARMTVHADG